MSNYSHIKYVYLDLDGTVANKTGKISDKNIEAIRYLKSKGIKVSIATGRTIHTMQEEVDKICPDLPIITANGGAILSKNKTILNEIYLTNDYWKILDILIEIGFSFVIYTKKGMYTNNEQNKFFRRIFDRAINYDKKYINFELETIDNLNWLKRQQTYKILVPIDSDYEKDIIIEKLRSISNIEIFPSSGSVLEICPKGVTKGNAIKTVATATEIDLKNIMVFGDNDNDISMFELVDNSVCLLNGSENAKSKAKFVTELECENDGFANFVFKYL